MRREASFIAKLSSEQIHTLYNYQQVTINPSIIKKIEERKSRKQINKTSEDIEDQNLQRVIVNFAQNTAYASKLATFLKCCFEKYAKIPK